MCVFLCVKFSDSLYRLLCKASKHVRDACVRKEGRRQVLQRMRVRWLPFLTGGEWVVFGVKPNPEGLMLPALTKITLLWHWVMGVLAFSFSQQHKDNNQSNHHHTPHMYDFIHFTLI